MLADRSANGDRVAPTEAQSVGARRFRLLRYPRPRGGTSEVRAELLLDAEALAQAHEVEIDLPDGKTASRVLQAEHLIAIAPRTSSPKDSVRIIQLLDANAVDKIALEETLERHGLSEEWRQFRLRHDLEATTL